MSKRWFSTTLKRILGEDPRTLAFQAWMADQIGRRFWDWEILSIAPGWKGSTSTARCRATARCLRCDTIHEVNYRNMVSGASRMCRACGIKNRDNGVPVIDMQETTLFPSMMAASRSSGLSYNRVVREASGTKKCSRFIRVPRF
jgi:hypothetical protein